jgi:hypothetical protein
VRREEKRREEEECYKSCSGGVEGEKVHEEEV